MVEGERTLKKLAFLSDNPLISTGQARVIRELGAQWRKRFQLVSLGWYTDTDKLLYPAQWDVIPMQAQYGMRSDVELQEIAGILQEEKPDILFCLGDLMHFMRMRELRDLLRKQKTACVGYLNVDGTMVPPSFASVARAFDHLVGTSQFGAQQLSALVGHEVPFAHHGVDADVFRPLKTLTQNQPCELQQLFDEEVGTWDEHFIVLGIGRNVSRKALPTLLEIYAAAQPECPQMRLLLVTNPRDPFGASLIEVAAHLGVLGKLGFIVTLPVRSPEISFVDDEALNTIYNRANVTVIPSLGEGFGLHCLESMAAGTPVLAADNSALHELVANGRGMTMPCYGSVWMPQSSMRLRPVDVAQACERLIELYEDWRTKGPKLRTMREKGLAFARARSWRACAEQLNPQDVRRIESPLITGNLSQTVEQIVTLNTSLSTKRQIFVAKFGGLGDYVQLIPVLAGIRRRHPEHEISLLCERNYGLFDLSPLVDRVLELGPRPQNSVAKTALPYCDALYDVRYVSRVYSTVFPEISSGPKAPHQWFYDNWAHSNQRIATLGKHVIDIMIESLDLVGYCSRADLTVPTMPTALLAQLPHPYVVVHNAAGNVGKMKLYDPSEFRKVVQWMQSHGLHVVQAGASKDEPLIASGIIDLRGRTQHVYELAAILQNARLYFGVEGGLMHLAKAVGTPHAAFFSITPPVTFAYEDTIVLTKDACPPCWWRVGAAWSESCPLDHPTCINFPDSATIIARLAAVLGQPEERQTPHAHGSASDEVETAGLGPVG